MDEWNVKRISGLLEQSGIAKGRETENLSRWLWEDILGKKRYANEVLSEFDQQKLEEAIERLQQGEPVQYIAGYAWFYGFKFSVDPDVLIPRPETEELVAWIIGDLKHFSGKINILDIGTGSGCIGVTLAMRLGANAEVDLLDISGKALQTAKSNAASLGVEVSVVEADILSKDFQPGKRYDVIVSNPPYVSAGVAGPEIRDELRFEPPLALFPPGDDPDVFYRHLIQAGGEWIKEGGLVYFELNEYRAETVKARAERAGWQEVEVRKDLQGNPRMMRMRAPDI